MSSVLVSVGRLISCYELENWEPTAVDNKELRLIANKKFLLDNIVYLTTF